MSASAPRVSLVVNFIHVLAFIFIVAVLSQQIGSVGSQRCTTALVHVYLRRVARVRATWSTLLRSNEIPHCYCASWAQQVVPLETCNNV